ncbi:hypothetical protein HBN50_08905 [Halobacteriovorax sp. GB3]|uniref:hypothetical protein n=1 Tax=Halobacteriovorax sp. GB3 TaxID=2719615 RepID=UPI002361A3CB|nr:hypothetical protein [Halobacteriovorax sp. GB3]MDD0853215.1 hypothetical protein [Halobacteriovorax sp. GB3]
MSFAHDYSSQGNKKSSKHSLHAYYDQTFKARVGTFGLFFLGFLAFTLSVFFLLLAFTYSPKGQAFLQNFKLRIFY